MRRRTRSWRSSARPTNLTQASGTERSVPPSCCRPRKSLESALRVAVTRRTARTRFPPPPGWVAKNASIHRLTSVSPRRSGVWIHGDGQGEVLNLQLRSPGAPGREPGRSLRPDRFHRLAVLRTDRTGRPSLVRTTNGPMATCTRSIANRSSTPRFPLCVFGRITCSRARRPRCYLSPIKALPLVNTRTDPSHDPHRRDVLTLPVEIESGSYLEFRSDRRLQTLWTARTIDPAPSSPQARFLADRRRQPARIPLRGTAGCSCAHW